MKKKKKFDGRELTYEEEEKLRLEKIDIEQKRKFEEEAAKYYEAVEVLEKRDMIDKYYEEFKKEELEKEKKYLSRIEKKGKSSAKKLYEKLWNKTITEQDIFCQVCWHNMFGALLDEREDDVRISVFGIIDSGTGKSAAVNFNWDILRNIIPATIVDELTDAGLLGGIDESIRRRNIEKNLFKPGDKHITRTGNIIEWIDPEIPGELERYLWIGFDEGENVLKPGTYNIKIQKLLRKTMDKRRKITKRLKLNRKELDTNTTFLITSFPIPEVGPTLLTQGLFQRCLVFFKDVDDLTSRKIEDYIIDDRFSETDRYDYLKDEDFNKLIDELKDIKRWYTMMRKSKNKVVSDKGVKEWVKKSRDIMVKECRSLSKKDRGILNTVLRRGIDIIFRLAYHNAVERKSMVISLEDVKKAFSLYKVCFLSVRDFIINLDEMSKLKYYVVEELKDGSKRKSDLNKKIAEIFDISIPTAISKLRMLKKEGIIVEKQDEKDKRNIIVGLSRAYKDSIK